MEQEKMEELLETFENGNQSYFREEVRKMNKEDLVQFSSWLSDNSLDTKKVKNHIELALEGR